MKVYGGIDVVEVQRVVKSIKYHNQRFLKKYFTDLERTFINYSLSSKNKKRRIKEIARRCATHFAAKEATMKLLGQGGAIIGRSLYAGKGIPFKEIELYYDPAGKPHIHLYGYAKDLAIKLGLLEEDIEVTISHEKKYIIARALAIAPHSEVFSFLLWKLIRKAKRAGLWQKFSKKEQEIIELFIEGLPLKKISELTNFSIDQLVHLYHEKMQFLNQNLKSEET